MANLLRLFSSDRVCYLISELNQFSFDIVTTITKVEMHTYFGIVVAYLFNFMANNEWNNFLVKLMNSFYYDYRIGYQYLQLNRSFIFIDRDCHCILRHGNYYHYLVNFDISCHILSTWWHVDWKGKYANKRMIAYCQSYVDSIKIIHVTWQYKMRSYG